MMNSQLKTMMDKLHIGRLLSKQRVHRAAAWLLSLGLLAEVAASSGAALAAPQLPLLYPPQVERAADGTSPEDPKLQIEGNFVRDEFGFLTGTFELALRVQTPTVQVEQEDGSIVEEARPFRVLSVNLTYDTSILHPVSWDWVEGADPNNTYDIDINSSEYYGVKIPTQKNQRVANAAAESGIVTYADSTDAAVTDAVRDGQLGLLHINATAKIEEAFETMTTVAVIRFAVTQDVMDKVSIQKDPTVDGGYKVFYDETTGINNMTALMSAMGKAVKVVDFATYNDYSTGKSRSELALYYTDAYTQLYYIPDYIPGTSPVTSVTAPTGDTVDMPDTDNTPAQKDLILARPKDGTGSYSYLTNLLSADSMTFPVVSKLSFVAREMDYSNLTTIVYVDWDNTILGTQIVPKGVDVREMVSNHVAEEFVHPELKDPTPAQVQSIKRADSYRGRYPYSGPGGPDSEKFITGDLAGENFPLTYKLDYTFFKRAMTHPDPKPDPSDYNLGKNDPDYITALENWNKSDSWVQESDGSVADYSEVEKYPFAYGWAECTFENYQDVWTTMGTLGELNNYATNGGIASVDWTGTEDFKFANLEEGFRRGTKDTDTVFLKAIYEPGDSNEYSATELNYFSLGPVYYGQYGVVPSAKTGTSYVVRFQYERVTEDGRGIRRTREPSVRVAFTPFITETDDATGTTEWKTSNPFYMEVPVDNADLMDVEITPASDIYSFGYRLVDGYDNNYVTGEYRSDANENILEVDSNFDFEEYPLYEDHFGTDGFVFKGVYQHLLEVGLKAAKGSPDDLEKLLTSNSNIYWDLNFMKNDTPAYFSTVVDLINANRKLKKLFETVYNSQADGDAAIMALDWHQIQYHLLTANSDGSGGIIKSNGSIMSKEDCIGAHGNFDWCKLHGASGSCTGSGGSGGTALPVDTWQELLDAAYDYDTHINALNNLTAAVAQRYSFVKDTNGTSYATADISALKMALKDAVLAANTAAGNATAYQSLTWGQVQYYLLNGSFPATIADADDTARAEYWWVNSGVKATDLATMLTAAQRAAQLFTTPDGNVHTDGWPANLKTITSDMDKVTDAPLRLRESKHDTPADGSPFADADAFEQAIKNLVVAAIASDSAGWNDAANGLGNWDILQYHLIHYPTTNTYDPTNAAIATEADDYWWRYGDQVKDWATLMAAADTYADGTDLDAKLLQSVSDSLLTDDTAGLWLRKDERGTPYAAGDMGDFVSAMKAITDKVTAAGGKMADRTWSEVQYMIAEYTATSTVTWPIADSSDVQDKVDNYYWWKDGGKGVVDLATLLQAAQEAYGTDGTDGKWASLNSIQTAANIPDHLKKGFDGSAYDDADLDSFRNAIKELPGRLDTEVSLVDVTWPQVQYYLLHDNTFAALTANMTAEATKYYWWRDGNTSSGSGVSVTAPADPETAVDVLLDAAFRSAINNDASAWDGLASDTLSAVISAYYLYPEWLGTEASRDDFTKFGSGSFDKAYFTGLMDRLAKSAVGIEAGGNFKTSTTYYDAAKKEIKLTWYQIQYALIHNGTIPEEDTPPVSSTTTLKTDYWWLKNDSNAGGASPLDEIMALLNNYVGDGCTNPSATANKAKLTLDMLAAAGLYTRNKDPYDSNSGNARLNDAKTRLFNLAKAAYTKADNQPKYYDPATGKLNLSWYQIQYYIVNPPTTATVIESSIDIANDTDFMTGITVPAWVPAPTALLMSSKKIASLIPMLEHPEPIVTEKVTTSEDGLTTTTKTTTKTFNEETGDWDTEIVDKSVTRITVGDTTIIVTTITTTVSTIDLETGEYITATETITTTAPEVPEPSVDEPSDPSVTQKPAESAEPTESEEPTESAEPTESPEPAESAEPTESSEPTESPEPSESEGPAESPDPAESEQPAESPEPTGSEIPGGNTDDSDDTGNADPDIFDSPAAEPSDETMTEADAADQTAASGETAAAAHDNVLTAVLSDPVTGVANQAVARGGGVATLKNTLLTAVPRIYAGSNTDQAAASAWPGNLTRGVFALTNLLSADASAPERVRVGTLTDSTRLSAVARIRWSWVQRMTAGEGDGSETGKPLYKPKIELGQVKLQTAPNGLLISLSESNGRKLI